MTETLSSVLEWGVATRALEGETESGDLSVVRPSAGGALLVAIDGLGHGPEAAVAARKAAEIASREHASLSALFEACHRGLRKTRGVVMSAAHLDARRDAMEWMGVGNIEVTLVHGDGARNETIMLFGGVAGHHLPKLRPSSTTLRAGDILVFATDGVHGAHAIDLHVAGSPQEMADRVLERHGKASDDALVLVARYLGGTA